MPTCDECGEPLEEHQTGLCIWCEAIAMTEASVTDDPGRDDPEEMTCGECGRDCMEDYASPTAAYVLCRRCWEEDHGGRCDPDEDD